MSHRNIPSRDIPYKEEFPENLLALVEPGVIASVIDRTGNFELTEWEKTEVATRVSAIIAWIQELPPLDNERMNFHFNRLVQEGMRD